MALFSKKNPQKGAFLKKSLKEFCEKVLEDSLENFIAQFLTEFYENTLVVFLKDSLEDYSEECGMELLNDFLKKKILTRYS